MFGRQRTASHLVFFALLTDNDYIATLQLTNHHLSSVMSAARSAASVSQNQRIAAEQQAEQLSHQLDEAKSKLAGYEAHGQSRANLQRRIAAKEKENNDLKSMLAVERRKSIDLASRLDDAEANNLEVNLCYHDYLLRLLFGILSLPTVLYIKTKSQ
jgi:chromosome segregation ATPase